MSLLGSRSAKKKAAKAAAPVAAPAAASAPSAPKPARGVVVEKPKANIYTVLLVLTFVAIVVGSIFLYAEMSAYEFNLKAR